MMADEKRCAYCGAPLPKHRSKYCSDACSKKAKEKVEKANTSAPKAGTYYLFTCPDCGQEVYRPIKCKRCEYCQWLADKASSARFRRTGAQRPIGSMDKCLHCGKDYIVMSSRQKYCPACKAIATKEQGRQNSRERQQKIRETDQEAVKKIKQRKKVVQKPKKCAVCGKEFYAGNRAIYCSMECRKAGLQSYSQKYEEENRDVRRAKARARWAEITPQQRAERNAKAREYARNKKEREGSGKDGE